MEPIDESDLEWAETIEGDAHFRRKRLSEAAGGDAIGCSLYELPPGKRSWPYHYHTANEEAVYVLSGSGTLRSDGETHPISMGTMSRFPRTHPGATGSSTTATSRFCTSRCRR